MVSTFRWRRHPWLCAAECWCLHRLHNNFCRT